MSFSIGSVQAFIQPTRAAYYVNPQSLQDISRSLDQNRDGFIGRDELNISPYLSQQLDSNGDRRIQLRELTQGLTNNQISIQGFSRPMAQEIAGALIGESIYAFGLGRVGEVVDTNNDGFVTRYELSRALNEGAVVLSGSYLMPTQGANPPAPVWPHPGHPGQHPGHGVDLRRAQEFVDSLQSNKMKKDRWGNDDPTTGIFTATEANQKINAYLEKEVLESQKMSLTEKFSLLTSQKMKKDRWGNYDPAVGSLTGQQAQALAEKTVKVSHSNNYQQHFATDFIQALTDTKMKKDRWGNDDFETGLLTDKQVNTLIKDFIQQQVIDSRFMTKDEKLNLIRNQVMKKDRWGNDDPQTGCLTAVEAQQLSKKVFENG